MQVSWCAVSGLLDHLLLSREEHTLQVQERGRGTLGCVRSVHNVTALMNTLCLPTCRGGGCPIPLTAATSLHVVTHSVTSVHTDYSCMCVGCNVRLTVNKQTNNHITLTRDSSPHSLQIGQGICCRGTQRMHKRCTH